MDKSLMREKGIQTGLARAKLWGLCIRLRLLISQNASLPKVVINTGHRKRPTQEFCSGR